MSRARRARRIAATAAYGGGGVAAGIGALGAIGYAVLKAEAMIARRVVGVHFDGAPDDNGLYGAGIGDPVEFVVLGDSSAAGMGADNRYQTVGAIIANGISALTGRPVRLTNAAVVGAESSGLEQQLTTALAEVERPHVAVIMVGANDVTHRIDKAIAVRHLETAVVRLRELGTEVVVGTCPDLGTVTPIPQPLRLVGRRWSRDLAAAQTVAVVEAGGRTVSLGDLLGPEFYERPHELFSQDRFHPSPAGYARCAAALLPSVYAALGVWEGTPVAERLPDRRRGEGIGPVAVAAEQAVLDPGTEVSAVEIAGHSRGPRGRWAKLLRRPRNPVPNRTDARRADQGRTDEGRTDQGRTEGRTDQGRTDQGRTHEGRTGGARAAEGRTEVDGRAVAAEGGAAGEAPEETKATPEPSA
jgi:lysophospholipase L1-like esterase